MAPNETYGALRRHEEYYINGGDLHLVVDRTRFRIHRYFYERESEFFRRILLAPASPGATRQGTSDENAIELDYVSSDEFAKFNWVFYNPKYSLYDKSSKDWIIILRLAYRWGFPNVHGLAVRELDKLYVPDIERVSIYQDYAVDRRKLVPCYAAIAERAQPLSLDEGERLGLETVIMLAQAREYARAGPQHDLAPAGLRQDEMEEIVKEVFDIEALPVDQLYPTAYEASNGSSSIAGSPTRRKFSKGGRRRVSAPMSRSTSITVSRPPTPSAQPRILQEVVRSPSPPPSRPITPPLRAYAKSQSRTSTPASISRIFSPTIEPGSPKLPPPQRRQTNGSRQAKSPAPVETPTASSTFNGAPSAYSTLVEPPRAFQTSPPIKAPEPDWNELFQGKGKGKAAPVESDPWSWGAEEREKFSRPEVPVGNAALRSMERTGSHGAAASRSGTPGGGYRRSTSRMSNMGAGRRSSSRQTSHFDDSDVSFHDCEDWQSLEDNEQHDDFEEEVARITPLDEPAAPIFQSLVTPVSTAPPLGSIPSATLVNLTPVTATPPVEEKHVDEPQKPVPDTPTAPVKPPVDLLSGKPPQAPLTQTPMPATSARKAMKPEAGHPAKSAEAAPPVKPTVAAPPKPTEADASTEQAEVTAAAKQAEAAPSAKQAEAAPPVKQPEPTAAAANAEPPDASASEPAPTVTLVDAAPVPQAEVVPPAKAEPAPSAIKAEPAPTAIKAEPASAAIKAEPASAATEAEPAPSSAQAEPASSVAGASPTPAPKTAPTPTTKSAPAPPANKSTKAAPAPTPSIPSKPIPSGTDRSKGKGMGKQQGQPAATPAVQKDTAPAASPAVQEEKTPVATPSSVNQREPDFATSTLQEPKNGPATKAKGAIKAKDVDKQPEQSGTTPVVTKHTKPAPVPAVQEEQKPNAVSSSTKQQEPEVSVPTPDMSKSVAPTPTPAAEEQPGLNKRQKAALKKAAKAAAEKQKASEQACAIPPSVKEVMPPRKDEQTKTDADAPLVQEPASAASLPRERGIVVPPVEKQKPDVASPAEKQEAIVTAPIEEQKPVVDTLAGEQETTVKSPVEQLAVPAALSTGPQSSAIPPPQKPSPAPVDEKGKNAESGLDAEPVQSATAVEGAKQAAAEVEKEVPTTTGPEKAMTATALPSAPVPALHVTDQAEKGRNQSFKADASVELARTPGEPTKHLSEISKAAAPKPSDAAPTIADVSLKVSAASKDLAGEPVVFAQPAVAAAPAVASNPPTAPWGAKDAGSAVFPSPAQRKTSETSPKMQLAQGASPPVGKPSPLGRPAPPPITTSPPLRQTTASPKSSVKTGWGSWLGGIASTIAGEPSPGLEETQRPVKSQTSPPASKPTATQPTRGQDRFAAKMAAAAALAKTSEPAKKPSEPLGTRPSSSTKSPTTPTNKPATNSTTLPATKKTSAGLPPPKSWPAPPNDAKPSQKDTTDVVGDVSKHPEDAAKPSTDTSKAKAETIQPTKEATPSASRDAAKLVKDADKPAKSTVESTDGAAQPAGDDAKSTNVTADANETVEVEGRSIVENKTEKPSTEAPSDAASNSKGAPAGANGPPAAKANVPAAPPAAPSVSVSSGAHKSDDASSQQNPTVTERKPASVIEPGPTSAIDSAVTPVPPTSDAKEAVVTTVSAVTAETPIEGKDKLAGSHDPAPEKGAPASKDTTAIDTPAVGEGVVRDGVVAEQGESKDAAGAKKYEGDLVKIAETPALEPSTTTTKALNPVKEALTPAKEASAPTKEASTTARETSTSAKEASTLAHHSPASAPTAKPAVATPAQEVPAVVDQPGATTAAEVVLPVSAVKGDAPAPVPKPQEAAAKKEGYGGDDAAGNASLAAGTGVDEKSAVGQKTTATPQETAIAADSSAKKDDSARVADDQKDPAGVKAGAPKPTATADADGSTSTAAIDDVATTPSTKPADAPATDDAHVHPAKDIGASEDLVNLAETSEAMPPSKDIPEVANEAAKTMAGATKDADAATKQDGANTGETAAKEGDVKLASDAEDKAKAGEGAASLTSASVRDRISAPTTAIPEASTTTAGVGKEDKDTAGSDPAPSTEAATGATTDQPSDPAVSSSEQKQDAAEVAAVDDAKNKKSDDKGKNKPALSLATDGKLQDKTEKSTTENPSAGPDSLTSAAPVSSATAADEAPRSPTDSTRPSTPAGESAKTKSQRKKEKEKRAKEAKRLQKTMNQK